MNLKKTKKNLAVVIVSMLLASMALSFIPFFAEALIF